MSSIPSTSNGIVLNSWKEIAQYLGRGVRTVQRYEHDLGLPVRRPRGKSRSAVIALSEDLDRWLRCAPTAQLAEHNGQPSAISTSVHASLEDSADLRNRIQELRSAHAQSLGQLVRNLSGLVQQIRVSASLREFRRGYPPRVNNRN